MATTPQPPHKPPTPPPPPLKTRADDHPPPAVGGGHLAKQDEDKRDDRESARPTIGVKGTPIEDGSRDPDTIAEEQRRRSADMEKEGIEAWKARHDDRSEEEKRGAAVEGVKHVEHHKAS